MVPPLPSTFITASPRQPRRPSAEQNRARRTPTRRLLLLGRRSQTRLLQTRLTLARSFCLAIPAGLLAIGSRGAG